MGARRDGFRARVLEVGGRVGWKLGTGGMAGLEEPPARGQAVQIYSRSSGGW
eukprot:COSAG02_NODE_57493_length_280_cov_0.861878_1_plen_51_part_01